MQTFVFKCSANVANYAKKTLHLSKLLWKSELMMDKLKSIYLAIKPLLNKYLVTVIVFLVFIIFIDENNVIRRVEYEMEIKKLKREIRHYRQLSDASEKQLGRLQASNAELERVAREDYLMKKPGEEVYIVE